MQASKNTTLCLITIGMVFIGYFSVIAFEAFGTKEHTSAQDTSFSNLLQYVAENQQLTNANEKLQAELSKYQAGATQEAIASEQLEKAKIDAGLIELTGPGILITLDDSNKPRDSQAELAQYLIHEEYLRAIVNALWNGGAKAIAINNQRLTTHTEIFCSGSYIQINGTRQMPPYKIVAIGNQNDLKSALEFYLWYLLDEYQQLYGIIRDPEYPIEPVTVPAAKQFTYRFAEPVKEGQI